MAYKKLSFLSLVILSILAIASFVIALEQVSADFIYRTDPYYPVYNQYSPYSEVIFQTYPATPGVDIFLWRKKNGVEEYNGTSLFETWGVKTDSTGKIIHRCSHSSGFPTSQAGVCQMIGDISVSRQVNPINLVGIYTNEYFTSGSRTFPSSNSLNFVIEVSSATYSCSNRCSDVYRYTLIGNYESNTPDCNNPTAPLNYYKNCACTSGTQNYLDFTQQCTAVPSVPSLNIPNVFVPANLGNHNNLINLKNYTIYENIDQVAYSIVSQSSSAINCSIDSAKYLDCNVNAIPSFSQITISASTGAGSATDSFIIYSGNFSNGTAVGLTYPLGGERLSGNVNLLWTAVNFENHPLSISFYYSRNNGSTWNILRENETNDGQYLWNTRNYPDGNYLLKVKAFDSAYGTSVYDQMASTSIVDNPSRSKNNENDEDDSDCNSIIQCSGWSECNDGVQTRTCEDVNFCSIDSVEKSESRVCGSVQNMEINLQSNEPIDSWKNIFLWVLPIFLIIVCIGIIFAMFLSRKK